jgi:hypothetical protein
MKRTSVAITFFAFFTASKTGKTGLTVTVDVYRKGSGTALVTAGSATALGGGLYYYDLASGSTGNADDYLAIFKTTDTTVDFQHVPSLQANVGLSGTPLPDALPGDTGGLPLHDALVEVGDDAQEAAGTIAEVAAAIPGIATDAAEANTQATSASTNALTAASKATTIEADYMRRSDPLASLSSQAKSDVWSNPQRTLTDNQVYTAPVMQFRSRTLVRGDSYGDGGRSFAVSREAGAEWPDDLSDGWTWTFTARRDIRNNAAGSDSFTGTATVTTATGDGRALSVALSAAVTAAAAVGLYRYDVEGTKDGVHWTVELGTLNVVQDATT